MAIYVRMTEVRITCKKHFFRILFSIYKLFILHSVTSYLIFTLFAKITKFYTPENQAKRIVRSAKRQLKKSKKNWLKWYKKYGKYSNSAWNIVRTECTETLEKMRETGFNYNNSEN